MRWLPAAPGHLRLSCCLMLLLLDTRNRRASPAPVVVVSLPDLARSNIVFRGASAVAAATASEGYTMDCSCMPPLTNEVLHESREALSSSTEAEAERSRATGSRSNTSMILATMVKSDLASRRTA
jgi:3-hydroxyisobutyrate dehydrogenase-like beta-hydroxyacid dehydrogenase